MFYSILSFRFAYVYNSTKIRHYRKYPKFKYRTSSNAIRLLLVVSADLRLTPFTHTHHQSVKTANTDWHGTNILFKNDGCDAKATSPKRTSFEKMFLSLLHCAEGKLEPDLMLGKGSMCDNTLPARDKRAIVCDRAGSTNMPLGTLWVTML